MNAARLNEKLSRELAMRNAIDAVNAGDVIQARNATRQLAGFLNTTQPLSYPISLPALGRATESAAEALSEVGRLLDRGTPDEVSQARRILRLLRSRDVSA